MANVANVKVLAGNKVQVSGSSAELTGSSASVKVGSTAGVVEVTGSLIVNGQLTASSLFVNTITSGTTVFTSGSTQFGDQPEDSHTFTGSVNISGALSATTLTGDGSGLTGVIKSVTAGNNLTASTTNGAVTVALTSSITGGLTNLTASNISASNLLQAAVLSASTAEISGNLLVYGSAILNSNLTDAAYVKYVAAPEDKIEIFPGLKVSGSTVVSGNLNVTGSVSASSFTGSGAALTNLQLSALAGASEGKIIIGSGSTFVTSSLTGTGGITITSGSGVVTINSAPQGLTKLTNTDGNIVITEVNAQTSSVNLSSSVTGLTNLSSNVISGSTVLVTGSLSSLGSLARSRRTVTANTAVSSTDQVIFVNPAGNTIVTLPSPTAIDGREIVVKRVDSPLTAFSVDVSCSVNIDDANTFGLNGPMQSITLVADSGSVKWFVV